LLFSSFSFLFYFLPVLLGVYYLAPKRYRNAILLLFSFVFYAWGGVSFSIILIASIIFNFIFAKQIEKKNFHQKKWLIVGLVFNVLIIVSFKYLNFFITNLNWIKELFNENAPPIDLLKIVLPVGISFFTFQQMSMLWDIYREEKTEKITFLNTALYISFFPQLIAGPIVRYNDIIDQLKQRTESVQQFNVGVRRFIIGLSKKILLANTCGEIADTIINTDINFIDSPTAWLGIIAYTFQIYFDFSGYSDMAIGLGKMFGFDILENFNLPYISKSITEFWRRWHISLSSWFKDYVYIPLGGNRHGKKRMYKNLLLVFLLTGFWHGATWSFILWGLFHGLFLVIEKIGFGKWLKKSPPIVQWFYTIILVMVGWVLFRIEELPNAIHYLSKMFFLENNGHLNVLSFLSNERIIILIIAAIVSSSIIERIGRVSLFEKVNNSIAISATKDLLLLLLFITSLIYINSGSYNPFIYYRF